MPFTFVDIIALSIFILSWSGYSAFARKKAKSTHCLARSLHQHRILWMHQLLTRTVRVSEASLLANLERNITFFASSTLLILAGIFTLFAQVDTLERVISSLPFTIAVNHLAIQLKLILLTIIFVISFFQFTWSMRQYGFLNVMVGAAPIDIEGKNERLKAYAKQMATVQDQAAHAYNYGLRSYYFAIAAISWFVHPLVLIVISLWVVHTLYRREFDSKAVIALTEAQHILNGERELREEKLNSGQ